MGYWNGAQDDDNLKNIFLNENISDLMQKRRNSSVLAMELCLFSLSHWYIIGVARLW